MSSRTYRGPADRQLHLPGTTPRTFPTSKARATIPPSCVTPSATVPLGLFPSDNIRLVTERTMAEVLRETEDFLTACRGQDTLLLYYSGHGMLGPAGRALPLHP